MNPFLLHALSALVPLIIGFIWYNPKVFGTAWLKSINMTEEQMKGANMALIFGVTYVFSYMLSFFMQTMVLHQFGVNSLVIGYEETSQAKALANQLLATVDNRYNLFKHGVLHGTIAAVFVALPVLGINALFERRSAKYIFIHLGYWFITMGLMGGIICQFSPILTHTTN